jgi:hypothetical protein
MMHRIAKLSLAAAAAAVLAVPVLAVEAAGPAKPRPQIQIAILLDTSNSMDGLIDQARRQLWSIVNEFIGAKKDGARPELKVALYEYGNSRLPAEGGYIRKVLDLTDDLDKVSQELFALKTNGGDEYCGMVIGRAVADLAWSGSREDLKLIYIAGNEPFTQGKVDYRESCKAAITKGIIVNTIHCGSDGDGRAGMWQDGAKLGEGKFACIDQNAAVAVVSAPQDKRLAELGAELNKTYVAYGRAGKEGEARQAAQDKAAGAAAPAVAAERAVSKSSGYYRNSSWDLVDAVGEKKADLAKLRDEELPENMRKMGKEEREKYVAEQAGRRVATQAEINKLQTERAKYIAEEQKKQTGGDSLGSALVKSAQEQAARSNFKF